VTCFPSFAVRSYSLGVNRTLSNLTLTVAPFDPSGSTVQVLNPSNNLVFDTQINGSAATIAIPVNLTIFMVGTSVNYRIVLTAWDGVTVGTYTVSLTRIPNRDATLQVIASSPSKIDPPFNTWTTNYHTNVSYTVSSFALRALTNDPLATVRIGSADNYGTATAGSGGSSLTLSYGINRIPIVVTAEDPTVVLTYTVTVTRFPDPTIPIAWFLSGPAAVTQQMTSTLTYTGAVNGAGCAACTFYCLLDGMEMVSWIVYLRTNRHLTAHLF
jgi:hypothetical protein